MAEVLVVQDSSGGPTSQETRRIGTKVFAFPQKGPSKMAQHKYVAAWQRLPKPEVCADPAEPSGQISALQ